MSDVGPVYPGAPGAQPALSPAIDPSVLVFDRDACKQGYVYTASSRLSCRLATANQADAVMRFDCFSDRTVLEMGCGDGYYTFQYYDRLRPRTYVAVDAAPNAVELVRRRQGDRDIRFEVGDCHHLPFPDDSFDSVLIQGVLHHDGRPQDMIREAFRVGRELLILEPNGNSPALKVIEKASRYHREHGERSYRSRTLRRWIEEAGGTVVGGRFSAFVPMFCPGPIARLMKRVEPALEATPGVRALCCSLYVVHASRTRGGSSPPLGESSTA